MGQINDLRDKIHEWAKGKGFWATSELRSTPLKLMLCVSELSEALEADRKNYYCDLAHYDRGRKEAYELKVKQETLEIPVRSPLLINTSQEIEQMNFEYYVKDTFEDELADTIIRILDLCGAKGIDIEKHIELKMKYNETREKMHGKKY